MSKHTSAPWVIADDGTIEAKHAGLVGYVSEVNDADRNLIAAAPELLAALKIMVKMVNRTDLESLPEINQACEAIAKAEGREQ